MRVLVTGGAGFIGSHLVDRLLARGDSVILLDDLSTGRLENVAQHEGNPSFLAAAVGVRTIIEKPLASLRVNVRGTENVLAYCATRRVPVVVFSSSEIYGKSTAVPFREDADRLLGPTTLQRWSYSTAKALDEILALAYHREQGLPAIIVRCFNTCGPRQTGRYGMVVPTFVRQALRGEPITVHGDGTQTRCFASVFDVVEAIEALLACESARGEIFNVGSDEEVTILALAERVRELTGSRSEIRLVPYEEAYAQGFEDMQRRIPDLAKIREFVGYVPKRSLTDILNSVIERSREEHPV
jgi:UDP-glucose 4-epimerase